MPGEIISGKDAIDKLVDSIMNARPNSTLTPPRSSAKRIPKVRGLVKNTDEYEKYYVPKVVSIGPYHYGKEELQSVQNLKPRFAEKFFKGKRETLRNLYEKLFEPQMVSDLRSFYDEHSMPVLSDEDFIHMMFLDSCFIVFCIISFNVPNFDKDFPEFKSGQVVLANQDMFLLENQIPLKVVTEVAQVLGTNFDSMFTYFIYESSTVIPWWVKTVRWSYREIPFKACDHLLHFLHHTLVEATDTPKTYTFFEKGEKFNYRNVSELVDVGIHFKPSSRPTLANVEFSKGWLRFSASVQLPRIKVNGSTKPMLLNLIAFEACLRSLDDAWVTSYVCLLDTLIDNVEDVKILRKSWVLETSLGSDEEVAKLFNEIGTNLVSKGDAYSRTTYQIQKHYESRRNTLFWQLTNEYFKSPWAIFVFLGALIALFLTGVQTYFSVRSPKSECDDLCSFLKINHHL